MPCWVDGDVSACRHDFLAAMQDIDVALVV